MPPDYQNNLRLQHWDSVTWHPISPGMDETKILNLADEFKAAEMCISERAIRMGWAPDEWDVDVQKALEDCEWSDQGNTKEDFERYMR